MTWTARTPTAPAQALTGTWTPRYPSGYDEGGYDEGEYGGSLSLPSQSSTGTWTPRYVLLGYDEGGYDEDMFGGAIPLQSLTGTWVARVPAAPAQSLTGTWVARTPAAPTQSSTGAWVSIPMNFRVMTRVTMTRGRTASRPRGTRTHISLIKSQVPSPVQPEALIGATAPKAYGADWALISLRRWVV